jgi:hypothetical protein
MKRQHRVCAGMLALAGLGLFAGTALAHDGGGDGATIVSSSTKQYCDDGTTRIGVEVKTKSRPDATDPTVTVDTSKVKIKIRPAGEAAWTITALADGNPFELEQKSKGHKVKARGMVDGAPAVVQVDATNGTVTCALELTLASVAVAPANV